MFYCFQCEDCDFLFEIKSSMSKIEKEVVECPSCLSKRVFRDYRGETKNFLEGPKTLGSYADRNTTRLSEDYKQSKEIPREPIPDGSLRRKL